MTKFVYALATLLTLSTVAVAAETHGTAEGQKEGEQQTSQQTEQGQAQSGEKSKTTN